MPTRNTGILSEIVEALGDQLTAPADALTRLEQVYADKLLIVAGDVQAVAKLAEHLRLAISTPECAQVLDQIGTETLANINIDVVEDVINTLFTDRFIEP